jgi:hypothetical protein
MLPPLRFDLDVLLREFTAFWVLGLSDGVLMIFDRSAPALSLEERVREEQAVAATGKRVRVGRG